MSPRTITVLVTHEFDQDTRDPADQEKGTFWDPEDTEIHDTPEARQEVRDRITAWENDEWHYVGVIVRVSVTFPYAIHTLNRGTIKRTAHDHAEHSLWGIEDDSGDDYFIEVAQDLAGEALHELGLAPAHAGLIDKPEGTWEVIPF